MQRKERGQRSGESGTPSKYQERRNATSKDSGKSYAWDAMENVQGQW